MVRGGISYCLLFQSNYLKRDLNSIVWYQRFAVSLTKDRRTYVSLKKKWLLLKGFNILPAVQYILRQALHTGFICSITTHLHVYSISLLHVCRTRKLSNKFVGFLSEGSVMHKRLLLKIADPIWSNKIQ